MAAIKYTTLLVIFCLLVSCEKLLIEKDQENTNENNFELLWTTIDRKYSFFEYKNVNWDSIYHVYRPKIDNTLSGTELFNIMGEMVLELRDGHVNIYSDFNRIINYDWYADYPVNFNYNIILGRYLGVNHMKIGPFQISAIDSVGYIFIRSFSEQIEERDMDMITDLLYDMKGIIIDVRHNSGGLGRNARLMASRFADRKRLVSYSLYKSGPGHDDFTSPQANYISPEGKKQFTGPVVVITNRRTYSATNDFVLQMSAFPHVVTMGDITGGGGGTPYDYELLNGWRYRFPRTQTLAPDGFNVEHGIPPAIPQQMRRVDEERGIDTIIETAINYLNK